MIISRLLPFFICLLLMQVAPLVKGQTVFTSAAGTTGTPVQWNLASSWSCGGCGKYPGQSASNDIVIVDAGHGIYLGTAGLNITVGAITISDGTLIVRSTSTLNAASVAISSSGSGVADFSIFATASGSPTVNITGDVTIDRNTSSTASTSAHTRLRIGASSSNATFSTVTIGGNLTYNYNSASNTTVESSSEILVGSGGTIVDNCQLIVAGDVSLNYNFNSTINNNVLSFEIGGNSFASMNNLYMTTTESGSGIGSDIRVATKDNSGAALSVTNNVIMKWDDSTSPNTSSDIYLKAGNEASDAVTSITIGGNLSMISNYSSGSTNNWIRTSGSSSFKLNGALNFTASSASTKAQENQIELYDASSFEIKGAITNTDQGCFDFEPAGTSDNSTITFSGSIAQNFPTNFPTTAGSYYKNLVINNSSGISFVLPTITKGFSSPSTTTDVNVKSSLQMLNGIISGSSTNTIILEDGATVTSGNASSFVDGMMKKKGGTSNNSVTFPLGAGSKWAPLTLSNISGADATTLMGFQYFHSGYSVTTVDATLANVSPSEYWNTVVSGTVPQVSLTFFWEDACASGISDVTTGAGQNLFMGGFNGVAWSKVISSTINSGSAACDNLTPSAETGSITVSVNTFTPYTFAVISGALPIKLLSFQGVALKDRVHLSWSTAEEQNVESFVVEHSIDGHNFSLLNDLAAQGNGLNQITEYAIDHTFPSSGMNYYRLGEIDLDGSRINQKVIAVVFSGTGRQCAVYPNPVVGGEELNIWNASDESAIAELFDMSGNPLIISLESGLNKIPMPLLRSGIYIYKIMTKDNEVHGKLIIK